MQATCYETDKKYAPLDMSGQARSVEAAAVGCQKRCTLAWPWLVFLCALQSPYSVTSMLFLHHMRVRNLLNP